MPYLFPNSIVECFQDLERQESVLKSDSNEICSKLQAEVNELENMLSCGNDDDNLTYGYDLSLHNLLERLNSVKRVSFHLLPASTYRTDKDIAMLGPLLLSFVSYV